MRYLRLAVPILIFCSWTMGASAGDPAIKDTNEYIKQCGSDHPGDDCVSLYELVVLYATVQYRNLPKTCEPKPAENADNADLLQFYRAQVLAIMPWLKQHPEYGPKDPALGIEAAVNAIYPCK